MLALQISATKPFMASLLAGDLFDIFLLEEATISTAVTYSIDGLINNNFFSTEEDKDSETIKEPYLYTPWAQLKTTCFNLIKGKRTPTDFKFVFQLMPQHVASILQKGNATVAPNLVRAFVLTVKYDGEKVILCTGTSYTTFLLEKEPEQLWDAALKKYLMKNDVGFEEL